MPTLTNIEGKVIVFKPSAIDAITDHDEAGRSVTCVYGIFRSPLRIREPVQDLMQRLGIEDSFALLTRPNGSRTWINASSVSSLREPAAGEYPGARTVISLGSMEQSVAETLAEAIAALNARDAQL